MPAMPMLLLLQLVTAPVAATSATFASTSADPADTTGDFDGPIGGATSATTSVVLGDLTETSESTSTSATTALDNCTLQGLSPYAKYFFDEECLLHMQGDVACPLDATQQFFDEISRGMRVETAFLNWASIVALFCLLQLGGVPDPRPNRESGNKNRVGKCMYHLWLAVLLFQCVVLFFTVVLTAGALVAASEKLGTCMMPWGEDGAPFLYVAMAPLFIFQPVVMAPLSTLFGYTILSGQIMLSIQDDLMSCEKCFGDTFVVTLLQLTIVAIFVLSFLTTATVAFFVLFLPMALLQVALYCVSLAALVSLFRYIIQPLWDLISGQLSIIPESWRNPAGALWWVYVIKEKVIGANQNGNAGDIIIVLPFIVLASCPAVAYSGAIAWHVYAGHTHDENMALVSAAYGHHFGVFWDLDVEWSSMLEYLEACSFEECVSGVVVDAVWAILGLTRLLSFDPAEILMGVRALAWLNTWISTVRVLMPVANALLCYFCSLTKGNVQVKLLLSDCLTEEDFAKEYPEVAAKGVAK